MTLEEMVAKQVRISRQETAHIASVSFDQNAANMFQAYSANTLGFTIKRCGRGRGSRRALQASALLNLASHL